MPVDAKTKYKAKKTKIVFFDIDDTLRVKKTGYIPESIKAVFKGLKEKGILTGIATGRGYYGVVEDIRDLEPDYFVTINGTYVINRKGEEIYNQPLAREVTEAFVAWCKEIGIAWGFAGKDKPVVSERSDLIDDAMKPVYGLCDVEPDFHLSNDVYHMWTFAENDGELELPEELATHVRLVPWHEHSSDVVANGISKASGVEHVLEHENLKPVNAMMFGDGPNDMEIFDYVGLKIAMGNATPELKEKADYVTGTVEEDGIFNALEELGLVEKELHFPQLDLDAVEGPVVTIKTNHGDLVIKLFPDHAPLTVTNFVNLAKSGYYDGVIFHRIIKDFMIQGGDPEGTGVGGPGYSIKGEFSGNGFQNDLKHTKGVLSMARTMMPDTAGSQFFIMHETSPHLDGQYAGFGKVIEGIEVVDKIASVATDYMDKPLEEQKMKKVTVEMFGVEYQEPETV